MKKFFKVGIGPPGLFLCVKTLKIRRRIFTRAESLAACVPGPGEDEHKKAAPKGGLLKWPY